jgi:biotin operon repressor
MGEAKRKSHAAVFEKSERLQKVEAFLRANRHRYVTTLEITLACYRTAAHQDVHELRENGFIIDCRPAKGKKNMYEYLWMGRKPQQGELF